jgi:hypothetical protein
MTCLSYAEADRIRQLLRGLGHRCVIRSFGPVGGSD